ncbi:hypothetical protein L210DRAFT_3487120 [Boletus edulis BED1]|uniref:G domain-containing protein n=1 Tax=Boletus edulis BED1 TaxID=1328754 RepID=A0AAD4BJM1_BOLED|nr:hypothetical protein L210DRAFT_3487120 [Boletus edulis BED1]
MNSCNWGDYQSINARPSPSSCTFPSTRGQHSDTRVDSLCAIDMDNTESTIDDILKNIPRFRILCVGRSGVGKSSLINRVFGITEAKVSTYAPGEASIDQEFVSDENEYFVLHDSKGFEPGNNINFELAAKFLQERNDKKLLKDRLHAIWLCTETPRAGGRVLEEGEKKLLALAYKLGTPVVVVFTKYDLLEWSKRLEEEEEEKGLDEETLRTKSKMTARDALKASMGSLNRSTDVLHIRTPPCTGISVSPGYEGTIATLVDMTRTIVEERLKGDAWVTWAIAQRANLPMKIEACVDKGVNFYYRALTGITPGTGNMLLWECLAQVHQDIVTCWNFRDKNEILGGTEFKQLMLYLVQDLKGQSPTNATPSLDKIGQFVQLITASTLPIAPPVAILGLTYFFVKWVSDAVLQHIPEVEALLMAYTIDLISVLKALFDFTLKPDLAGTANWEVLKEAFEDYERSNRRKDIHDSCRSLYGTRGQFPSRDIFRQMIKTLLDQSLGLVNSGVEVETSVQ